MYTENTKEFQELVIKSGRRFKGKLNIGGNIVESGIKFIKFKGGAMSGSNISIGNTVSATIEVEMQTADLVVEGVETTVFMSMLVNEKYEDIQMGVYYPQSPTITNNTIKFTAADALSTKAGKLYISELAYPALVSDMLAEICNNIGIELATTELDEVYVQSKPEGYTCREVIGYIAGLIGKFACINRFGNLEIRWFEDNAYEVNYKQINFPTVAEKDVSIGYIECAVDNDTIYSVGEGLTGIQISNPYMTEEALNDIYEKLSDFTYRPAEIPMLLWDLRLDPWDVVTIHELGVKVPCMVLEITFDGGVSGKIKAVGKTAAEKEASFEGPTSKKINRYYSELILAGKIMSKVIESNKAVIEKLDAGVANINTLMFGSATGTTITTDFANAVIAVLGNAQITSAMIKEIAASQIMSGDILTNKVRVMSEDGSLVIADATISISDTNRVRVQIGKDASGDYSINIWDSEGNLMISEGGITDSAIKQAIIRDDMVSDTANINAKKLDIDSLFEEINGSKNTIKSTQVYFDSQEQTLDILFGALTNDINEIEQTQQSQGTQISAVQGQIESKIWQTDIDQIQVGGRNLILDSKDLIGSSIGFIESIALADESSIVLTDENDYILV